MLNGAGPDPLRAVGGPDRVGRGPHPVSYAVLAGLAGHGVDGPSRDGRRHARRVGEAAGPAPADAGRTVTPVGVHGAAPDAYRPSPDGGRGAPGPP